MSKEENKHSIKAEPIRTVKLKDDRLEIKIEKAKQLLLNNGYYVGKQNTEGYKL